VELLRCGHTYCLECFRQYFDVVSEGEGVICCECCNKKISNLDLKAFIPYSKLKGVIEKRISQKENDKQDNKSSLI